MATERRATETHNLSIHAVECPHCGYINSLSDIYSDLRGPEAVGVECYECEKIYRAVFHVSISVRAIPLAGGEGIKNG